MYNPVMKYTIKEIYLECLKQFAGIDGKVPLGGTSVETAVPGSLSDKISAFIKSTAAGDPYTGLLPEADVLSRFFEKTEKSFADHYSIENNAPYLSQRADTIFNSDDPIARARSVSELWSPELSIDDDEIFESWLLKDVEPNPEPYRPEEIIIQLNALYSPAAEAAPADISPETAEAYRRYIEGTPERVAVYDHPVPVFTRGAGHELEKCLSELDGDTAFEKQAGVFPSDSRLKVLISISTTHDGLDSICEMWLKEVLEQLSIAHLDCYLLSETKCRELDNLLGPAAGIFYCPGQIRLSFRRA